MMAQAICDLKTRVTLLGGRKNQRPGGPETLDFRGQLIQASCAEDDAGGKDVVDEGEHLSWGRFPTCKNKGYWSRQIGTLPHHQEQHHACPACALAVRAFKSRRTCNSIS